MNNTYLGISAIFVIILFSLYSNSKMSGIETFYNEITLSDSKVFMKIS